MIQDPEYARQLLPRINCEQASKNLERKISSIVTDACNECLGAGTLQFCGGEICPSCSGTGKPPSDIDVHNVY